MLSVVVVYLGEDKIGRCFKGFKKKSDVLLWLAEYGYTNLSYRWIIFDEEETV